MSARRRIIRLRAANRVGVLERVAAVFAERGLNIEELVARGAGEESTVTIAVAADDRVVAYVRRILERLRDVSSVEVE